MYSDAKSSIHLTCGMQQNDCLSFLHAYEQRRERKMLRASFFLLLFIQATSFSTLDATDSFLFGMRVRHQIKRAWETSSFWKRSTVGIPEMMFDIWLFEPSQRNSSNFYNAIISVPIFDFLLSIVEMLSFTKIRHCTQRIIFRRDFKFNFENGYAA